MKLLDSAVLVDIDRGAAPERVERLDEEGRHGVSIVSVTELFHGVEKRYRGSGTYTSAVGAMEAFLSRFEVFPVDPPVAKRAAEIIVDLRERGESLNDLHDIYVASTAITEELVLLTPNTDHFDRIQGLKVQDWEEY